MSSNLELVGQPSAKQTSLKRKVPCPPPGFVLRQMPGGCYIAIHHTKLASSNHCGAPVKKLKTIAPKNQHVLSKSQVEFKLPKTIDRVISVSAHKLTNVEFKAVPTTTAQLTENKVNNSLKKMKPEQLSNAVFEKFASNALKVQAKSIDESSSSHDSGYFDLTIRDNSINTGLSAASEKAQRSELSSKFLIDSNAPLSNTASLGGHPKPSATLNDESINQYDGSCNSKVAANTNLINELINQPIPDQKDVLRGLRLVRCPYNQSVSNFLQQKKLANQALKHVFETLSASPNETELANDPTGLTVSLMQHQQHALKWMQFLEKRHPFGGLLTDDMGLGKTLSMLALVMAEKDRFQSGQDKENLQPYTGNTVVVCPPSLLRQWETEVNTKFDCTLMPLIFYGQVDKRDIKNINKFDVVITSYDMLLSRRLAKHIFKINWRRVILDEAHLIRNTNTQRSEAVFKIQAKHRWALTGSPIHNNETDVFALLKFLKYTPFDEKTYWTTWLSEHQRLGVLLRSIMLRRTKTGLQRQNSSFNLPPQNIKTIKIRLTDEEMKIHQAIMSFSRPLVRNYINQQLTPQDAAHPSANAVAHKLNLEGPTQEDYEDFLKKFQRCDEEHVNQYVIYVLLLRLQQVCCHPGLADGMLYDDIDATSDNGSKKRTTSPVRNASRNTTTELLTVEQTKQQHVKTNRDSTVREILNRKNPIFNLKRPSSKMLKAFKILELRVLSTDDKAVVVSQWTGYLSIISDFLASKGIPALHFNGKMSLYERQNSLDEFNDKNNHSKVLLLSLKCGGVGLNLTVANHLILMDLHWNPQQEMQAQDRIYRLGQTKPVYIYKFLCTNTIEYHIKMKQENKLELANSVLANADSLQHNGTKFSIAELKKLFGIDE